MNFLLFPLFITIIFLFYNIFVNNHFVSRHSIIHCVDTIIKENENTFRADNPVQLAFASNLFR